MKVSVVMATYNGAAHVAEQLNSILANDRLPDELIVIDDHSTDGTMRLLRELLGGRREVEVIIESNRTNLGPTATFVKGILRSTGDVVLTADQDDRWAKEKIGTMVREFQTDPNVVMTYSDGTITDAQLVPNGRTIFSTRRKADLHLGQQRDPTAVAANPDIKGCTMAMKGEMVRSLLAAGDPLFQRYWGHDHWIALFAFGLGKVTVLSDALIDHRMHGRNTSAGAKFRPWSPKDWRKWMLRIRQQSSDHDSERYRIALQKAEQLGSKFSQPLKSALQGMHELSLQREALKGLPFPARIRSAMKIRRHGHYTTHYNGTLTLLRDLFL